MARSRRKRSAPGRRRKSRNAAKTDTRERSRQQGAESAAAKAKASSAVGRGRFPSVFARPWPYATAALSLLLVVVIGVLLERGRSETGSASRPAPTPSGPPQTGRHVPEIANLDQLDPGMARAVRQAVAAVRRDPGDAAAYGHLGRTYHAHDYIELAHECYERAQQLAPQVPDWPYYLGFFAAERGETREAARYFEKVIDLREDYLPAYFRLGNVLVTEGRLDEAQTAYQMLVTIDPRQPWGYLGLGRAARRRDKFEEAAKHLGKALDLDPENRETLYLLAMVHLELGQEERASELLRGIENKQVSPLADPILERALRETRDLQAQIAVANGLLAEERFEAAENIYRSVLDSDPESFEAHLNLGVVLGLTGRNEEAERVLTRAITLEPKRADARTMLAIAYLKTQRPGLAFEALHTALELDPNNARAREILTSLGVEPAPAGDR